MAPRLALVFCAHHKPWLMMSTLLTVALQDALPTKCFVLYQEGNGTRTGRSPEYDEYRRLAHRHGANSHLSDADGRVLDVCRLRGIPVETISLENDGGLDSGAWYKFIRSHAWEDFDYVLFLGEGTLLARANTLASLVSFATERSAHFVASGHEKRRLPKDLLLLEGESGPEPPEMGYFHDRMMQKTFDVFCRDPEFERVFDAWAPLGSAETENHVPDIWGSPFMHRLRAAVSPRHDSGFARPLGRAAFRAIDEWTARLSLGRRGPRTPTVERVHVNGQLRPLDVVIRHGEHRDGVWFHRADEPEWFGCATNHLFSRSFLRQFDARLLEYSMYDVLEVPFAASALEVVWGFVPSWLGIEKWFTDGFHRVRKHFVTYRREDEPWTIASYINRYHRGLVVAGADGDWIKVRRVAKQVSRAREILPDCYFR